MKRRRTVAIFGLSFLDVMFCGFGSVILLVMIVNAETVEQRETVQSDLRNEVDALQRNVLQETRQLAAAQNSLAETAQALLDAERNTRISLEEIDRIDATLVAEKAKRLVAASSVDTLKSELKALDQTTRRLDKEVAEAAREGSKAREFAGEDDRQYLTGLKVGGQRILILVDASASMLADTVVNVVRLRNMDEERRRGARKWRQTLLTVEWLASQLPQSAKYQIYTFNTQANPVLEGMEARWLPAANRQTLDLSIEKLREVVPADGTSLHHAFNVISALKPTPDNVILLTDGLPTQGASRPRGNTVSSDERLKHFSAATNLLSKRVPINVILFPMEGDPFAAAEFWKLAAVTGGSFMTPSKDWP